MLKKVEISLYLEQLARQTESKAIMTRSQMLAELSEIAWNKETRESDRISAMASLAKLQGMNTEKSGTDVNIQVNTVAMNLDDFLQKITKKTAPTNIIKEIEA